MFRIRELRCLLVEPRFQFGNQEFAVDEEEFRHYAFEALPYELDGIEVRAVRRQVYQPYIELVRDILHHPRMMGRIVVQNHDDRPVAVRSANGRQESGHVLLFRAHRGLDHWIPVQRIESEEVRAQLVRVLHGHGLLRGPEADGVGGGLRGALVLEPDYEVPSGESVQSILESFFKTASASSGRR